MCRRLIMATLLCASAGMAQVVTCPAPEGGGLSADYRAWANDAPVAVYGARTLDPPFAGKRWDHGGDYAFANFDMAGSVTVRIESPERSLRNTVIRPQSARVTAHIVDDHTLTLRSENVTVNGTPLRADAAAVSLGEHVENVVFAPPPAVTFHVSPTGDDAAAGSADAPFATLRRARDAVRAWKRKQEGVPDPVNVVLHCGVHRLETTLQLTPEDSGAPGAPITYEAAPGARPVISGGRRVTGWRRTDGPLWVADVPWLATRETPIVQLFVNGVRRNRARHPNAGAYLYTKRLRRDPGHGGPCDGLTFRDGDLEPWDVPDERVVCLFHNWVNSYNYVGEADWARRHLAFERRAGAFFMGPSVRYYVENAPEYLDAPGEWYHDRGAGQLLYHPAAQEDMATAVVIAPVVPQTLVALTGDPAAGLYVEHIVVRGLSFRHSGADLSRDYTHSVQGAHTQRAALAGTGLRHALIEDCEFTQLGEHGVALYEGSARNVVRRCHIHNMGGGGVYLSEGAPRRKDDGCLVAHNVVSDNIIHDGGHLFRAGCGVFLGGSASYNRIVHNDICDLSWMGIHLGWSWTGLRPACTHHNEVGYNHIHHLGNGVLNDIGGIYTLGVSPGTVLHHNLIHDITRFERGRLGYGGWGIYPDAGSSEILIENNVVHNTRDGGLHFHNDGFPYGNRVVNNIFAYAVSAQLIRNNVKDTDEHHVHIERNIVLNENAKMYGGGNWRADSPFSCDHNLFWSETTREPVFAGRSFEEWQAEGRDLNSVIADPLFVDAAARDFRLMPESPALKLGFVPIALDRVGVRGPAAWRHLPTTFVHREYETAPPPEENWPVSEDAEDYKPNDRPLGAVGDEGEARVYITERTSASGSQSLCFQDAPDVTPWKPHWYRHFEPRKTPIRFSCAVRNDPDTPATIELEMRDWPRGGELKTGPVVRLLADGSVHVARAEGGWDAIGTYPVGEWFAVELRVPQGGNRIGPWSLRLSCGAETLLERDDLPMESPAFTACNWVGIVGADQERTVFYIDDILLQ